MALNPGSRLGPYEILAPIGAGGMGEVYRARDERLKRDVAIKIMPASFSQDTDRLRRFEQEAQAAGGLNHPNITAVYDLGSQDGSPYIVTELLEGETLRVRLSGGPIAIRKAIDYAVQIAKGLAAAHEKGIIHRDLKPENLFLTKDGRAKILDFGLAKLTEPNSQGGMQTNLPTAAGTEPGVVMGTLGYMSPEQVKGKPADQRSDLFSFGAILYEMLSGARAFHRDSAAETISAILREEPPDLSATNKLVQPGLERIVRHCLEKNPEERFYSARDLAFDLEALSGVSGESAFSGAHRAMPGAKARASWPILAGAVLATALVTGAIAWYAIQRANNRPPPSFHQISFRRGTILSARFAPDGQTVLYSAAWDGKPMEVFTGRSESPDSRPFGLTGAELLSVSKSGDMAVSLERRTTDNVFRRTGTLAQLSVAGGAPREILKDVEWADFGPDGKSLAIVRSIPGRMRIEYPAGSVVYETGGWVSHIRVSPDGDLVAFADHPTPGDDGGTIAVVDRAGQKKVISPFFQSAEGVAWSPSGSQVWFTAAVVGGNRALYSTTRSGKIHLRTWVPGTLTLQDISKEGRILLTRDTLRSEVFALPPGAPKENDLTWLDWSQPSTVSPDGKRLLFSEAGEGGGDGYSVYLRKTDGSPAVRLGEGNSTDLSPDGEWALAIVHPAADPQLVAYPTGAGQPKIFPKDGIDVFGALFHSDGKQVLFNGRMAGRSSRVWIRDFAGGKPRAVTPEGYVGRGVASPDGQWLVIREPDRKTYLFPLAGGEPKRIPGLEEKDAVDQWSADGRFLYIHRTNAAPLQVERLEIATGRREPWKTLMPADAAGVSSLAPLPTRDGAAYAYWFIRTLSDLYIVDGLK
ncbi:MAG: serine/threonine-protein kinase [Acidobacteriota bacterium]|nr:serine/threonine-protein kinase [Acidobacteriota bacterium]